MSSAVHTGTYFKSANIFEDQFNNKVNPKAAIYVLSQSIKTILIPTESTKPWLENNNGLTFKSKDISTWGYNINKLFKLYYGDKSLDNPNKEHAIFDLIVPIIYYNNLKFNDENLQKIHKIYKNHDKNIIIECNYNNKHIIHKDEKGNEIKLDNIWDSNKNKKNKYIIIGNTNENDKRLLKIKKEITDEVNKYLKK